MQTRVLVRAARKAADEFPSGHLVRNWVSILRSGGKVGSVAVALELPHLDDHFPIAVMGRFIAIASAGHLIILVLILRSESELSPLLSHRRRHLFFDHGQMRQAFLTRISNHGDAGNQTVRTSSMSNNPSSVKGFGRMSFIPRWMLQKLE